MDAIPFLPGQSDEADDFINPAAFINTILGRHSVRRYKQEPVPRELIETLLNVAIHAPSAHNRQPWRFRVVREGEKSELATAMGARLRRDRLADGDPTTAIEADAARSYARITSAPTLIVTSLSMEDMDHYRDGKRYQAEYLMAVQSVAMAGQNLLLSAHALGLGACWVCAPLFCPDTVRAVLALPPNWQPQGMITLGYPEGAGKIRSRHPLHTCTQS